MNTISLCIPRVENKYSKQFINNIFNKCELGTIDKIDIVRNHKENAKYNRVFIHYKDMSNNFHYNRIKNGGTIKIVYETPWFWKCSESRISKNII